MFAKDIMTRDVVKVKKDTPAKDIVKLLIEKGISGVPVVDEKDHIIGVITEKDLLFKKKKPASVGWLYHYGKYIDPDQFLKEWSKIKGTKAEEIMSRNVVYLPENVTCAKIAELMMKEGIKRVFIVRGKRLVGVVSKADILKGVILGIRE